MLIVSLLVTLRTPTDIFPSINIPIVSIVWQRTEAIGRRIQRTSEDSLWTLLAGFKTGFECLREHSGASLKAMLFRPHVKLILNALCE